MRRLCFLVLLPLALQAQTAAERLFVDTVQPLLKQQCLGCHGEGYTFADLDLTSRENALRGGKRGPAIVPGDPDASLLVQAVEFSGDLKMPPGGADKQLAAVAISAVRDWIAAGAPYASGERQQTWDYVEEDLWAFRPVRRVAPPSENVDPSAVQTPVDNFILSTLAEHDLAPGPRADKTTLIRRITYDLTGLPPTPHGVAAFLADDSHGAYKKVVERLLDSPAYGERWGRHWLDVVRYADTGGYSNDFERPNAWRYRDYVIRSFNEDKPYDRFILEQVAGDELWPASPDGAIATGFLRTGPWEHTGMSVAAETRQMFLDDVAHSVGTAFLGLTVGCARCHDHKFDPIPTKDYYSLQAVFASTAFARRPLAFAAQESLAGFDSGKARLAALIAQLEQRVDALHDVARQRAAKDKGAAYAARARTGELQRYLAGDEAETLKLVRKQLSMHEESVQRYDPLAFTVSSGLVDDWNDIGPGGAASYLKGVDYREIETHVLVGGDVQAPGDRVEPGALSAVEHYSGYPSPQIPSDIEGRRAALAKWIANPQNPLTARVMVNRIWQYHFGRALADNANNMGKMGKKPSHPELLDWLAGFFIDQNWSVKAVHRVIVLSEAYQRSTQHPDRQVQEKDPTNLYLGRFSPRRLEAEELRDAILAVSGELSPLRGGPGTYPQINSDVARQPRHAMGTLRPAYQPSPAKADRNRRSIYSFQQRSLIDPLIESFNGATVDLSCERRESSTVPTQAFALLNSEFSHDMALAMAARLERQADTADAQIELAFRLAFNRAPTPDELSAASAHVARMQARHEQHSAAPRPADEPVIHEISSELTGESYSFQQVESTVEYEQNLHPSEASPHTRALAALTLALLNANEFVYVY
ncbi:MAG: PSD1 and planctomycete cytochrome C domain-containing protein [Acidobacteria bacterium]|nr:PSD1 and planctomycete cytochrome C domain-containing protein [Acidobacteriota bacterium]MDA1235322.1 PSD1 and planctomycete cytochrome C domain-containing protein [Acidobacteriota bacterium]